MERDIPDKLDRECYAALCVVMEDLIQSVPERPLPAKVPYYAPNLEMVETFISH
jgi:hypothetical protein